VTASIGPRAISTSLVRHWPAVLPAPRGLTRVVSAHSGMLIRGGGRQPSRKCSISRLFCISFREVRLGLAKGFELLLDIDV